MYTRRTFKSTIFSHKSSPLDLAYSYLKAFIGILYAFVGYVIFYILFSIFFLQKVTTQGKYHKSFLLLLHISIYYTNKLIPDTKTF